jgi:hypothetical protein
MADYFTNFSLVVKLKEPEREYALGLATIASSHRFDSEQVPADFPPDLALVLEGWDFETEQDKDGIWLHSQNGGIDAACVFIQHLLRKFSPDGSVSFEWSHDCTKPRLDAYGGGAAFITARKIKSMSTSNWLQKVAR